MILKEVRKIKKTTKHKVRTPQKMSLSVLLKRLSHLGHIILVIFLHVLLTTTVDSDTTPHNSTAADNTSLTYQTTEPRANNPNITILHEVHEEGFSTKKDKPLVPEILPLKSVKKKPYLPLEKPLSNYEKPKPLKELELHPVIFDFNLGDLEDLEHETFKKKDLSAEEKILLRDADIDNIETISTLTYSDEVKTPDSETLQDDLSVQVDFVTTTTSSSISANSASIKTTTTPENFPNLTALTAATSPAYALTTPTTFSPHILKIFKTKSSKKGRELLKHEELPKGLNNHNSLHHYSSHMENVGSNQTAESLQMANVFQIVTNLYDHFYWQSSEIRNKVSTGCGLEMQAYLTGLHGNYHWAQRGEF